MATKSCILTCLLILPMFVRAQPTDTTRTSRPLRADPTRATTSAKPSATVPLNTQEMSQVMNALGGGSHPGTVVRTIDNRYEGLRGTPYFLAGWSKGQIEMTSGKRYVDVPIKFDAFRQALVLLRPKMGNDSIIIDAHTVNQFRLVGIEGQEYVFKRYSAVKSADDVTADSYFLVLYEGKTALLKRVAKTFKGADYKNPYSTDIRYDSFENKHTYYVLKTDQTLIKVKLSKKSLLDALADKGENLKALADQLSLKTETDAARLVEQYDK